MTIAKIVNNQIEYPPYCMETKNGTIYDFSSNIELCLQYGYENIPQELIDAVNSGQSIIQNNKITDNTDNFMSNQKSIKMINLQNQIDKLERIAGVRAFREDQIAQSKFGVKTSEYPNGKTLDIDNQIKELRQQIAGL